MAGELRRLPLHEGILGAAARTGRVYNVEDMHIHPQFEPTVDEALFLARQVGPRLWPPLRPRLTTSPYDLLCDLA